MVLLYREPERLRWPQHSRLTNRSSSRAARRAAGRERLRNAASGGTELAPVVSFLVWRVTVAGGPQLSSIR
jgi:hypothetical protein